MTVAIPDRRRLLDLLVERALRRERVRLASGAESDFYLDCKQVALDPEGAWALGHHLYAAVGRIERATGTRAGAVGGMTLGADPLATAVSLVAWLDGRRLPALIVRKTPKSHGTHAYVEGSAGLPDGTPVVVLEDVVTSGGTTLQAVERLRAASLAPFGVAVIVDRRSGGVERLTATGLAVEALFSRDDFPPGA